MEASIGRIVHYTVSSSDVGQVNRRRTDASNFPTGNSVSPGMVFPMMIVRVWGTDGSVNGQVSLDGNDTLWVTSVKEGEGQGTWAWPART